MLRMPSPKKRKRGNIELRRRVPKHLQAIIGVKEWRHSLGTKDPKQSKIAAALKQAEWDRAIQAAERRLVADAARISLTHKQREALAAEWLRRELAKYEQEPPDAFEIDIALDRLAEADDAGRHVEHMGSEVGGLLRAEGLEHVTEESRRELALRLFWRSLDFWRAMSDRRNRGAYGTPPSLVGAPVWDRRAAPAASSSSVVTLSSLWEGWLNANKRDERTAYQWGRRWAALGEYLKHDDAARVTRADARAWSAHLAADGIAPRTINDGYVAVARAVWQVAVDDERLPTNPFRGVLRKVDEREEKENARLGFTAEEAYALRSAAAAWNDWRKWTVLILMHSGARLEEVVGASAADVWKDRETGVWVLDINAKSRTLKNASSIRKLPLHSAVIRAGFLEYVAALPKGSPLFAELSLDRFGRRSSYATKALARLLRVQCGITDPRKVGAHGWRHHFLTQCRRASVPEYLQYEITGHAKKGEGAKYGEYPLNVLSAALERIPEQGLTPPATPRAAKEA